MFQAGITTTLNSRCSVLAAANSVFGRWDDSKGEENIDFMPTILSRFDMIFVIKDEHDEQKDIVRSKSIVLHYYNQCLGHFWQHSVRCILSSLSDTCSVYASIKNVYNMVC